MLLEPLLGSGCVWAMREDKAPEFWAVIEMQQMGDFVRRHVVENIMWRKNEAPGIAQVPRGRARTPAASLVADRDAPEPRPHECRIVARRGAQFSPRRELQPVDNPARDMRLIAGNMDQPRQGVGRHRSPPRIQMPDFMVDTTQRNIASSLKPDVIAVPIEPRRQPIGRSLNEIQGPCPRHIARNRDDSRGPVDVQSENQSARAWIAAENHRQSLFADRNRRRLQRFWRDQLAQPAVEPGHQAIVFTNCRILGTISLRNREPLNTP